MIMNDFDKQRVENAIWVLLHYKDELIYLVEDMEDCSSDEVKATLCLLEDIQTELNK